MKKSPAGRLPPHQESLQRAVQYHSAGHLQEAEALYRQILRSQPNEVNALNLLGLLHHQCGDNSTAATLIQKAVTLHPAFPDAFNNLGIVLDASGKPVEAIAAYRRAIALKPDYAIAHYNLANVLHRQGALDEAIVSFKQAIRFKPDNPAAQCNLGNALKDKGRLDEAIACYRQAIALQPDNADAHNNLGSALRTSGNMEEAIPCYLRAIDLRPDYLEALYNLGVAYKSQPEKAIVCYQRVLALKPDFAEAHNNLGAAFQVLGRLEDAINCHKNALALQPGYAVAQYNLGRIQQTLGNWDAAADGYRRAIELKPDYADAYNNLGDILQKQGRLDDAIASYRHALHINPNLVAAQNNLFFCLNFHPTLSPEEIFNAYQQWNVQCAAPLHSISPVYANVREAQRRLRIGYVSADFNNHSVIHFVAPLIELHDKSGFEIFCYYNNSVYDSCTERIIAAADHWIPCMELSDEQLSQRILSDGIDILIDLAGHTAGNRLLTFARKPAPVQATWLGFAYTTGLTAIDYFIGDHVFTPAGCESLFSETLYRLPHSTWVFQPPQAAPEPGESPTARNSFVTFGCLSRTERINARMIAAWAEVLRRLPGSRLRLDSHNFRDAGMRANFEAQFLALGVPATQLEIGFTSPVWHVYRDIDIVLDCFPHNSGTTTFEALWMGVPVITLADRPSVGRLGSSILACIGKQEWIAFDSEDYINRAVTLARDPQMLAHERATLRQAMLNSPLMNKADFVRDMEAAYRDMWCRWCENPKKQKESS